MDAEATLNAGDVCLDCQQLGLEKYLRYFKINLNGDTILKCESNQCMYPYNDEFSSSSDDEDKCLDNVSQTNSLTLINDLIQQFGYQEDLEDTLNHVPTTASSSEQVTQFDITFLDDFKAEDNENVCKTETIYDKKQYFPLLEPNPIPYDFKSDDTSHNFHPPKTKFSDETLKNPSASLQMPSHDNIIDIKKEKIKIQSVETLKIECPLYHDMPTTSKKLMITGESSTSNLYTPLIAEDQQKNISKPIKIEVKTNEINKNNCKSQAQKTLNSSKPSITAPLTAATKKNPTKSQTFDIPKAEILNANAILKKFVTIGESQIPEYNRKYKKVHKKVSLKNRKTEKSDMLELPSSLKTDQNYSFDKITQMLLPKK